MTALMVVSLKVSELTPSDVGLRVRISWIIEGETKVKFGHINMVGPNYIGLAIPRRIYSFGEPSNYYYSIPRLSINSITLHPGSKK